MRRGIAAWLRSLWLTYRDVKVDGARARYLCCGSGPPLLLLASPLALSRSYLPAVRSLSRSFTVVCVELPGSGGSERLPEPWSALRYAQWTLELVRHLPLAAPVVTAHGASAPIATELARIAPGELGGVVLIDPRGTKSALDLRALPSVASFALNAIRHPATFSEHAKNAYASSLLVAQLRARGKAVAIPVGGGRVFAT
ncbi:MAG: putative hydrolase or acyltransferase of alpha/beta superfamily [Labilithrix sp.]|nr:putative hydrolase or acyltransferase of alpha/beta superfamily [Labilithrix sp.]